MLTCQVRINSWHGGPGARIFESVHRSLALISRRHVDLCRTASAV
ncbi:putative leader peptide [Pseudonocardia eucalypti]